jgi:hypothetical protein
MHQQFVRHNLSQKVQQSLDYSGFASYHKRYRPYSQHFIFLIIMNGTNRPECFTLTSLSSLVQSNALAYWAHTLVTKKMKCCEYSPFTLFFEFYALSHLFISYWFCKMRRLSFKKLKYVKFGTKIGLHNPPDGITNPRYKLWHFLTSKIFGQRDKGTNFWPG